MSDETILLQLPYILPAQAQKPITHNDALRVLDAVIHLRVEDRDRNEPPSEPAEGQRHALGAEPTGSFAGEAGNIAAFQHGAWAFFSPQPGWTIWDAAEEALFVFHLGDWQAVAPPPESLPLLGIGTTADATNRLAVSAPATLLTHAGAGHQLKVNKAASGDTASLLFQSNWSGRAEMGLAGNDDFSVKVSPDGSTWTTAMQIGASDGNVGIGAAPTSLKMLVVSSGDASIGNRSTSSSSLCGFNLYDYSGGAAASFQYGNPAAATFTNAFVFASRQSTIPLKFYQGGTAAGHERLRIDASGRIGLINANVGVGTAEPIAAALLEARLDQASPNITRIAVNNPNTAGLSAFSLYGGPGNVERGRMQYNHGLSNVFFTTIGAIPFYIGTNDTPRIVITSAGSVNVTSGIVAPTASAKLQVDSTTQGFLPPRMTTTQRDAIASPAEGLMVYNTTEHEPQFWDGTAWVGM